MKSKHIEVDLQEPVLQVQCDEPDSEDKNRIAPVIRSVRFMPLTLESLHKFWLKVRVHRNICGVEVNNNYEKFVNIFLRQEKDGSVSSNGLFYVIDDFIGIFYLTNIHAGIDAQMHFIFFDKRTRGRKNLCKSMIEYIFNEFEFHRLSVEVPLYASKHTFNFVESLGFANEGHKFSAIRFDGRWFDIKQYSRLRNNVAHVNLCESQTKEREALFFGLRYFKHKNKIERHFGKPHEEI